MKCDMGYEHDETVAEPVPAPVVVDPGPNENDVRIAEIEASARIETEKIWTEQQALALEAANEELRGELRGMREVLDRLVPPAPDPADTPPPAPVVIAPDAPDEPESVAAPGETKKKAPKSGGGYWDGYAAS
jgi:hypothetical protein